jgi:hypothetical protein
MGVVGFVAEGIKEDVSTVANARLSRASRAHVVAQLSEDVSTVASARLSRVAQLAGHM